MNTSTIFCSQKGRCKKVGVLALRSIEQGNRTVSILHGGSKNCWQAVTRLTSGPWLLDTLKWPLNFLLMMCYRCIFWLHAIKQVHYHDSYPTVSFCNTPEKKKIERERERCVHNFHNIKWKCIHIYLYRWWFQIFFICIPTWYNGPIWLTGWNRQPVIYCFLLRHYSHQCVWQVVFHDFCWGLDAGHQGVKRAWWRRQGCFRRAEAIWQ